jgi:uncharacterized membrane protein YedE/YeeE
VSPNIRNRPFLFASEPTKKFENGSQITKTNNNNNNNNRTTATTTRLRVINSIIRFPLIHIQVYIMSLASTFTPISGVLGGGLIGLSAGTLLLLNGDILGASGIVSSITVSPWKALTDPSQHWKLVFLSSFLLTSTIYYGPTFDAPAAASLSSGRSISTLGTILAGFLVGFGTKLGNGCTTGHGICGLARMSLRSLASVMTFMATGVATTILTSPTGPLANYTKFLQTNTSTSTDERLEFAGSIVTLSVVGATLLASYSMSRRKASSQDGNANANAITSYTAKVGPAALSGIMFAAGLYNSGMIYTSKVFGFMDVSAISSGDWDPTLAMVMGGGLMTSWIAYQFVNVDGNTCDSVNINNSANISFGKVSRRASLDSPLVLPKGSKFGVPTSTAIDFNLLAGATLFGLGWGVAGVCPGPAILLAGVGVPSVLLYWWPSYIAGSYLANEYKSRQ